MKPDFVIVGQQKAGTSFLAGVLRESPQVFLPKTELPFFRKPFLFEEDKKMFFGVFKNQKKVCGIKDPLYYSSALALKRIKKNNPNTKIVIVVRNSVDRVLSAYFMLMFSGALPFVEAESGLKRIVNKAKHNRSFAERSLFDCSNRKFVGLWQENFDNVLVLRFEELIRRPKKIVGVVCDFLCVEKNFLEKTNFRVVNSTVYFLPGLKFLFVLRNAFLVKNNSLAQDGESYFYWRPKNCFVWFFGRPVFAFFRCLFRGEKPVISSRLAGLVERECGGV